MPASDAKLTVLMPVYNAEKYLREAIDSVLSQTHREFEFLIVDDGSTDGSADILKSYTDPRIRTVRQKNGGVSAALNTGLAHASGDLIARFDADDICYPERLALQYAFMTSHPDYVLAGSDADYMDKDGNFIFTFANPGHDDAEIRAAALHQCPFIHSTVIYRSNVVRGLGGYEVKAHTFEDYFLWTKLLKKGKVHNFKQPLVKVRFNPESVTVDARDYNKVFKRLHAKALSTGTISDEDGIRIKESIERLSPRKKEFSYNRMLAKKFLWNNYQPASARRHLWAALRIKPFDVTSWCLAALSMFPEKLVKKIYEALG